VAKRVFTWERESKSLPLRISSVWTMPGPTMVSWVQTTISPWTFISKPSYCLPQEIPYTPFVALNRFKTGLYPYF
jgi:hypothetical protein